jgi:hypothetical protein
MGFLRVGVSIRVSIGFFGIVGILLLSRMIKPALGRAGAALMAADPWLSRRIITRVQ